MMAERWRFLDSGSQTGADNMAIDAAMLEAHASGQTAATLRVYTWRPPAVSMGRFQKVDSSVDLAACRRLGIDVVRRPTGGRAILHTAEEVTFSLVVSAARLGSTGVMEAYRALAQGIVAGLRSLGLNAALVEHGRHASRSATGPEPACFAVKARCDLVVNGSKLVGSAQVQRNGFILQQNSLPLHLQSDDWSAVFLRSGEPPDAVGLWDAAGRRIEYDAVRDALRHGFASEFGVLFEEVALSPPEARRASELKHEVTVRRSPAHA